MNTKRKYVVAKMFELLTNVGKRDILSILWRLARLTAYSFLPVDLQWHKQTIYNNNIWL